MTNQANVEGGRLRGGCGRRRISALTAAGGVWGRRRLASTLAVRLGIVDSRRGRFFILYMYASDVDMYIRIHMDTYVQICMHVYVYIEDIHIYKYTCINIFVYMHICT